jgi:hypothetical protein
MNLHAVRSIYAFEMARTRRTLMQSIISPVISTSLYFVVFGAAIGSRIQQIGGISDPGQKLLRLEVDDTAKTGDQMQARRGYSKEREILEIHKGFRGWMGVEVAPTQDSGLIGISLFCPSSQHDPCALQRIASRALVQHQRYPVIAEDVLRMQRQP